MRGKKKKIDRKSGPCQGSNQGLKTRKMFLITGQASSFLVFLEISKTK